MRSKEPAIWLCDGTANITFCGWSCPGFARGPAIGWLLRFTNPVNHANDRFTTEDVPVGDVVIPTGE